MDCVVDAENVMRLNKENEESSDNELGQVFLAFARVYSGIIRKGDKLYVLGPKHDPAKALELVRCLCGREKKTFSLRM